MMSGARAAALLAPEPFARDLINYVNAGKVPDDPLLLAILTNDLETVVGLASHDALWNAVPPVFVWLWEHDPHAKCYGTPERVAAWERRGGRGFAERH
jgi:hypothetical protein